MLELAELCARFDVPHLVNNAYGLQSAGICRELQRVGEAIVRDQQQLQKQQQHHQKNGGRAAVAATGGLCDGDADRAQSAAAVPQAAAGPRYRLDVFVQSTDKNLLTPVGGTIIATFDPQILSRVAQTYPGALVAVIITYTVILAIKRVHITKCS